MQFVHKGRLIRNFKTVTSTFLTYTQSKPKEEKEGKNNNYLSLTSFSMFSEV